ncbi:MAG: response regulator transcription factor [Oscillospiraceae bacterium]|nr:response regulator transcription factor [Oscillospiraceae bacterium]
MEKKILIVDDEKKIVDILVLNLGAAGYQTVTAANGEEGLALALSENPDLILLDVMMPQLDGFAVCRTFREHNKLTPVIMLTAREEEQDMVYGLELGADDYITKPFSIRELLARVQTNIRRNGANSAPGGGRDQLKLGRLTLDLEQGQAYKDGAPVDLTQREYHLLRCLTAEPGRVLTREALMQEVWQYEYYGDLRAVDVAVCRLREKIEDDASNPKQIVTKRGAGYYFRVEAE